MDKTSLVIALLVVIVLLLCAPQAERSRALGRMVLFAGIGVVVYYVATTVLALWFVASDRFGWRVVLVAVLLLISTPIMYYGVRQDFKENEAIRTGSKEAFENRVRTYMKDHGYSHERAVEATLRIRDGDKKTDTSKGTEDVDPPRRTTWP
jgi:hypothetical protein